jgi:hypothetical protein
MSNKPFEHVMISRGELAKMVMEAKGFDPDKFELINMDIRSTSRQRILPLYMGEWTESQCPFDLFTFGVRKKNEDTLPVQSG